MARTAGKKYRLWTPEANALLACSPADHLPEGDLVFFLLDVVPRLDLSRFYAHYEREKRGAPPFDPAMLFTLLLYSYCQGVFSSRKIALACQRNLAFLAIVGDDRPDFRSISDFRKLHVDAFPDAFLQTLTLAAEAGMLGLGNLSFDGSKLKANASRHKAMSYGYVKKEKERLEAEVKDLLQKAKDADEKEDAALGTRRGDELPEELRRRQDRLATIDAAMKRLEEQARAEAEEERKRRAEEEAERQASGRKRRGKEPEPVSEEPKDKAQTNFTDPETKILPTSNKGWDCAGNKAGGSGRDVPGHRGVLRDDGAERRATGGAAGRGDEGEPEAGGCGIAEGRAGAREEGGGDAGHGVLQRGGGPGVGAGGIRSARGDGEAEA